MYCPKCAAENFEPSSYCRSCGEDLAAVAQVMKKHLPVALISKLDAAIERKDERLRRDAILAALAAVLFTVLAITRQAPFSGRLWALCALLGLLEASREYLAYRLSLEREDRLPIVNESSPPRSLPQQSDPYHCPQCQTENAESVRYCRSCGYRMKAPAGSLDRYLPAFLVHKLQKHIEKKRNQEPVYKSKTTLLFAAAATIMHAVSRGMNGEWGWMAVAVFMLIIVVTAGVWDLTAYRRRLPQSEDMPPEIDPGSFVLLRGFDSLPEAEMVNDLLVQQGIRSVAQSGNVFSPNAVILVCEDDFESAQDLYEEFFATESPRDKDDVGANGKQTIPLLLNFGRGAEPLSVTEGTTELLDPQLRKSHVRTSITEQTTDRLES